MSDEQRLTDGRAPEDDGSYEAPVVDPVGPAGPADGVDGVTQASDATLAFEAVSAGYGPFRALHDVTFSVPPGAAVALVGPNGAGKTTVARVCSGLVNPTSGTVRFGDTDISKMHAHDVARLGIAHAPEGRSVFATLTVEENLMLGFEAALGAEAPAAVQRAYDAFPKLGERRKQTAGTLSGGEQRMLSLARVLASPPKVLIADELSLGLAPIIVDEVFDRLAQIRSTGTSILVIEQHLPKAMELADEVVVLAKGTVVHSGPADSLAYGEIERALPGFAALV